MKGQVTIFLSIVFTLIASFIMVLIQNTKDSIVRMQIEIVTNAGLYSAFGEYNRELFNRYDLLFVDAGYGKDTSSLCGLTEHLNRYMDYNYRPYLDLPFLQEKQLVNITINDLGLMDISRATDEEGSVFYNQAVTYMKDFVGMDILQAIMDRMNMVSGSELNNDSVTDQRLKVEADIASMENTIRAGEADKEPEERYDNQKKENPVNKINAIRANGVVSYILPDNKSLSGKEMDLTAIASNRSLETGTRAIDKIQDSAVNRILFDEYILDKFPNYLDNHTDGILEYETEYILAGKNNDYDNLNWVINRLLLFREVCNVSFLFTDSARTAQAQALATAIVGFTGIAPLIELTKVSLLFAWAYAESIQDMKNLMNGGNIPLIKASNEWSTDLEDLYQLSDSLKTEKREYQNGLDYEDYLRILLYFEEKDGKTMRSIDMIEQNIRNTMGNSYFKMDNCVEYLQVYVQLAEGGGNEYEIIRGYGYNEEFESGE